ncbi:hypothetical protein ACFL2A_04295, partial [Thermodesulfobacteriota bacterium]
MASWNNAITETKKKKKIDVDRLLKKIDGLKKTTPAGEVVFGGLEYFDCLTLLNSCLKVNNKITGINKDKIIVDSLKKSGSNGTITKDTLLSEVKKKERNTLNCSVQRYVLCTCISIKKNVSLNRRKIDDVIITFNQQLNPIFTSQINLILHEPSNSQLFPKPSLYRNLMSVKIFVNEQFPEVAAKKAMHKLNFLCSLWNLKLNAGRSAGLYALNDEPVNKIVQGPLFTLHSSSGHLALPKDYFWYNDYDRQVKRTNNVSTKIPNMNIFEKKARKKITKLSKQPNKQPRKYENIITWSLTEYNDALNYRDKRRAFLKLWPVLERLTGTMSADYDLTVRRASFLWTKNNSFHKDILNHLRLLRNSFIHENESSIHIEYNLF